LAPDKANIDRIEVGPRGVYVIHVKPQTGGPTLNPSGGLFSPCAEKSMMGDRNQTNLVAGVPRQMDVVMSALERAPVESIATFGMLCFVETAWPLLGDDFNISGVEVLMRLRRSFRRWR
jgi:hypothetical protein